jgi:hypothetical protein
MINNQLLPATAGEVLGLFDDRYLDLDHAAATVGKAEFVAAGADAQRRAYTLLTNHDQILPIKRGLRIYLEGVSKDVASRYGDVVGDPTAAPTFRSTRLIRSSASVTASATRTAAVITDSGWAYSTSDASPEAAPSCTSTVRSSAPRRVTSSITPPADVSSTRNRSSMPRTG